MEKKPLSLEEIISKLEFERNQKLDEQKRKDDELTKLYEAQRQDILKRRQITGGFKYPTLVYFLGAFTFTNILRYDDNDIDNIDNPNANIDLKLSTTSENLFTFKATDNSFSLNTPYQQYPTTSLIIPIDGNNIEYATFAFNYDDGLIYSLYFNPDNSGYEFRSINLKTGESTFIDTIIGAPDPALLILKDLIYIGNNEFLFIDISDNTLVIFDSNGSFVDAITSTYVPTSGFSYFSNITEYNGTYYVSMQNEAPADLSTVVIGEIDISTGAVTSINGIFFNSSIDSIEPFASMSGFKVINTIALASTDEIPGYTGQGKLLVNLLIWDNNDLDLTPSNTWYVIAELNPDTGEATYIGDGSGVYDLFYYKNNN